MTTERSINLAVIAGDGIGPEIITEAQRVLQRACELDSIRVDSISYLVNNTSQYHHRLT